MTAPHAKPRLYYGCPLKASWMAKHFGMRLQPDCWTEWWMDTPKPIMEFAHPRFEGRFYIHADSLHLLNHQQGDIVLAGLTASLARQPGLIVEQGIWIAGCPEVYDKADGDEAIIERGGVAFMWPESEGA